jgi:hypothetical protein
MKVIFLDVDGPLNTHRSIQRAYEAGVSTDCHTVPLDEEAMDNLKTLVDATGAIIVVSSTWRRIHEAMVKQTDNGYDYRNDDPFPGHGEKSLLVLLPHLQLTDEEIMCIRYHMGAFVDQKEWTYYSKACKKYANVLYAHTADMLASQVNGV